MKIRTGFVSNSSSTSFTLDTNKTTFEIAAEMLKFLLDEEDEGTYEIIKTLNEDTPIAYQRTTNYETLIWRGKSGKIRISTCNNHEEIFDYIDSNFPNALYGGGCDTNQYPPKDKIFYNIGADKYCLVEEIYGFDPYCGDDNNFILD